MQKRNIIIALVVVVVLGALGFVVLHKDKTKVAGPTSSGSSTTPAAARGDVVQTKTGSSVGEYLASSSGAALYTYGPDTVGVSHCSGACLSTWPAYVATDTSDTLPANVTVIKRTDNNQSQYAYKGMPLYTFASDSSGQVSGDGVGSFHVAKP